MKFSRFPVQIVLASVLAGIAGAQGQIWRVDDNGGPGVHFTSIAAAVAAAVDGDVILVAAGSYSGFTLTKSLTILGAGPSFLGSEVSSITTVSSIAAGGQAVLQGMDLWGLVVTSCPGPVIFDNVSAINTGAVPLPAAAKIDNCADVRFRSSTVKSSHYRPGAVVTGSRVEFSKCWLKGGEGYDNLNSDGDDGYPALYCEASRIHLALCNATGGIGGDGCSSLCGGGTGGRGGDGLEITLSSEVIVSGEPANTIKGGKGGYAVPTPGAGGHGASVGWGSTLRYSSATFVGGLPGGSGAPGGQPIHGWGTPAIPPDPTLELIGTPTPGAMVTLKLFGVAGTNARLQQGNLAIVVDDGLSEIERLSNRIRLHPLGPMQSGTISYSMQVPSSWSSGRFRVFQGLLVDSLSGLPIERTNSVPFVVR